MSALNDLTFEPLQEQVPLQGEADRVRRHVTDL
jgi:hypothetical protein